MPFADKLHFARLNLCVKLRYVGLRRSSAVKFRFLRPIVALTALLVFAATANPVAAQEAEDDEPLPEGIETVEEETNVITSIDFGGNTATIVVDKTVTGTGGGNSGIASSADGPIYDCYFMRNWADESGVRTNDFVADTSAAQLEVGVDYWRLCLFKGTNINAGISPADIADNDIATWTVNGWALGPSEFQLFEDARNKLVAEAIPLTLSPTLEQITGIETWFESTAQLSIPAVCSDLDDRVCVRASLIEVDINPGDDSAPISCTSFNEFSPLATPDCSHTYLVQPAGGQYTMGTTTRWNIQFKPLDGAFGLDPALNQELAIVADYQVDVIDLEALITR